MSGSEVGLLDRPSGTVGLGATRTRGTNECLYCRREGVETFLTTEGRTKSVCVNGNKKFEESGETVVVSGGRRGGVGRVFTWGMSPKMYFVTPKCV